MTNEIYVYARFVCFLCSLNVDSLFLLTIMETSVGRKEARKKKKITRNNAFNNLLTLTKTTCLFLPLKLEQQCQLIIVSICARGRFRP